MRQEAVHEPAREPALAEGLLALRRRFGMLFQENALFSSMTARDNVAFPLVRIKRLAETEAAKRADDLLARAGRVSTDISDIIKRHPVELAALLRTTKRMTADDIARLARDARKVKEK